MTLEEMNEWVFDGLGFCGCGDPEGALDLLRSVLAAIQKRSDNNDCDDHTMDDYRRDSAEIDNLIGMNDRRALAFTYLYWLDELGLTEHGSNITGSWLTDKGRDILVGLNASTASEIMNYEASVLDAAVVI